MGPPHFGPPTASGLQEEAESPVAVFAPAATTDSAESITQQFRRESELLLEPFNTDSQDGARLAGVPVERFGEERFGDSPDLAPVVMADQGTSTESAKARAPFPLATVNFGDGHAFQEGMGAIDELKSVEAGSFSFAADKRSVLNSSSVQPPSMALSPTPRLARLAKADLADTSKRHPAMNQTGPVHVAALAKSMNSGNWAAPSVISRRIEQGNFRATMFNQPTTKNVTRAGKNTRDQEWTSDTVSTEFNYLQPTVRRLDPPPRPSVSPPRLPKDIS